MVINKRLPWHTLQAFSDFDNHEAVVEYKNDAIGLHAFVAIHNTARGPALGGCRMYPYPSRECAITDVLRLSRGMTYKAALAGLPLGGGKSVIIADPQKDKKSDLFHYFGQFLNTFGGQYIVAEDSGTSVGDMQLVNETTPHVAGIKEKEASDGTKRSGDPSLATAYGVRASIHAAIKHSALHRHRHAVSIQGIGNVGKHLARLLHEDGAMLFVSETINKENLREVVQKYGAFEVEPEYIYDAGTDIFAPCALGRVLNDETIPRLTTAGVRIIAGSANDQLRDERRHSKMLKRCGIHYVPDYLCNAGGLIDAASEKLHYAPREIRKRVQNIGKTTTEILGRADAEERTTSEIAGQIAEERFGKIR